MALSIKNGEMERLARELVSTPGLSVTEPIRQSLETEIAPEMKAQRPNDSDLIVKLREISDAAGRIPARDHPMTEEEILGYDELGIPTR